MYAVVAPCSTEEVTAILAVKDEAVVVVVQLSQQIEVLKEEIASLQQTLDGLYASTSTTTTTTTTTEMVTEMVTDMATEMVTEMATEDPSTEMSTDMMPRMIDFDLELETWVEESQEIEAALEERDENILLELNLD